MHLAEKILLMQPLTFRGDYRRAVVSKSKTGRGLATVPIFLLVPQVKLPKRLSLDGPAREAEARLPGLIVANWREV